MTTTAAALPDFQLPPFLDSSNGWGPASHSLPTHLLGLPFMPFNKGEKLNKVSDWSFQRDNRGGPGGGGGGGGGGARVLVEEEEIGVEDEGGAFSLVDTKVKPKPRYGYRPFQQQQRRPQQQHGGQHHNNQHNQHGQHHNQQQQQQGGGQRSQQRDDKRSSASQQAAQQQQPQQAASVASSKPSTAVGATAWNQLANTGGNAWTQQQTGVRRTQQTGAGERQSATAQRISTASNQRTNQRGGQQGFNQRRFYNDQKDQKPPSIAVDEEHWKLAAEIELSELTGVTFEPTESDDLLFAGSLLPFNPAFSRIVPRSAVPLQRYESKQWFAASTTEDPILNRMIDEGEGDVYATDSILSVLMAANKSVHGWDIVLKKADGKLVFDKRADSKIDYLSVNENHSDTLSEDRDNINHADHLSLEATLIAHNFSEQCLSPQPPMEFAEANPFLSSLNAGNEPAHVAFRYRSYGLGGGVKLIARSSVNGYSVKAGDADNPLYFISRALNEFDSKLSNSVEWKQKLDTQTGAALAIEMKNNAFRLARYVSEMAVSGADEVKLGFVSRVNSRNSYKHSVLMCKSYDPDTFASSINIRVKALWGSLKVLVDRLRLLDDGHYLLWRNPNKPAIHVYSTPPDAFVVSDSADAPAEGAAAAPATAEE